MILQPWRKEIPSLPSWKEVEVLYKVLEPTLICHNFKFSVRSSVTKQTDTESRCFSKGPIFFIPGRPKNHNLKREWE